MTDPKDVPIAELKAALAKATAIPWDRSDWSVDDGPNRFTIEASSPEVLSPGESSIWPNGIQKRRIAELEEGENPDYDAALIVLAVNSIPAMLAEITALREALGDIFAHYCDRDQPPGHCHTIPGIWDDDNLPDLAGRPCDWCAKWNRAEAALQGRPTT